MLGLCFVLQCFVSFLVLRSSSWGKESWLLYFYFVLNAMPLLSFFYSSSRCYGYMIVTFPGHTHLLFHSITDICLS